MHICHVNGGGSQKRAFDAFSLKLHTILTSRVNTRNENQVSYKKLLLTSGPFVQLYAIQFIMCTGVVQLTLKPGVKI